MLWSNVTANISAIHCWLSNNYKLGTTLAAFYMISFFFSSTGKQDLLVSMSKGAVRRLSQVQGPLFVQRPQRRMYLTPQPFERSRFSATTFSNSSTLNLASPQFLEIWIFWQPRNLNLVLQRASITCFLLWSLVWMDIMTWPVWTLVTVPWGFPKAPNIQVWSLDWWQNGSHEYPLERAISKAP